MAIRQGDNALMRTAGSFISAQCRIARRGRKTPAFYSTISLRYAYGSFSWPKQPMECGAGYPMRGSGKTTATLLPMKSHW